jgi:peptide/nickel transport system substrate-binding protein
MQRRTFLAASAATLAAPRLACAAGPPSAAGPRVLRFIPQSDLTILDPVWTTAYVTRNHAFAVFDTLYGLDSHFRPTPQMVAGAVKNPEDTEWRLGLRPGLKFHDGTPVLARDCVASIKRWGARDPFGQALLAATDELSAPDDTTIRFRLSRPFPLLPDALGKSATNMCAIMPERLALTDPYTAITEMVGSGPFRFLPDERVLGSRAVYGRFNRYIPLPSGAPDWTSGPKFANFDRIEWLTTPDPAAAAAALQSGEVDWWEYPIPALVPSLRKTPGLTVSQPNPAGEIAVLRMNQLHPPFDKPAIRLALLSVIDQAEFMTAVVGADPALRHVPAGFFTPGTDMASPAGMEALTTPRDLPAAQKALSKAGYQGETVVVLAPTDLPALKALADVGVAVMQRLGLKVDVQWMDWGQVVQRRVSQAPPERGGWSVFHTFWDGEDLLNPATNVMLRGNGTEASPGWPDNPDIEGLRDQWLLATDLTDQKRIAVEIQRHAFVDVPYIPLGQDFVSTAYRGLTGVLDGFAMFWNLKKG